MNLTVMLPDTADPALIDQLTAAITRMGGQVIPEATPPGELGPDLPPEGMEMALGENGEPGPVPPGMVPAEGPMDAGGSGIRRPPSLRNPRPAPAKQG